MSAKKRKRGSRKRANASGFRWTLTRKRAAQLVAEDDLTHNKVAEAAGIHQATLARWKAEPEFIARVSELRDKLFAKVMKEGIAVQENRVREQTKRWKKLQQVIQERSEAEDMQEVPGGKSGLLVRQVKMVKVYEVKVGEDGKEGAAIPQKQSREVEEFAVDTGLLSEFRQLEKQVAQEIGQWAGEKQKLLAKIDLSKLTHEQLERLADGEDPIEVILGK